MRSWMAGAAWAAAALLAAPGARAQGATDAELTFNTGVTHLREGRPEYALEAFKKAIKQDPKNPYFYQGLCQAQWAIADRCPPSDVGCRRSRNQEALGAIQKALELNPMWADARAQLGAALLRLGKGEEGRKELLAAYEDPMNPAPEMTARNLASAYLEEKNYVQAESWARTAVQRNRKYSEAHLLLADALERQGHMQEAIAQLETAAELLPNDPALLFSLGEAYYRAGRFSDAKGRLEQAAAKDPGGVSGRAAAELLKKFP